MSCNCNTVVDLNKPNLKTVGVRPTKANPDIKVVIGQGDDGHYEPKEIIYPDYYSPSEIRKKVESYSANNDECKVCQRYAEQQKYNTTRNTSVVLIVAVASVIGIGIYLYKKRKGDVE